MHPRRTSDYAAVLEDLARGGQRITVVVHAWTLAPDEVHTATAAGRVAEEAIAFHSLVALAQALGRREVDADPVRIQVLATGLYEVTGDEPLSPLRATLLGPCKVIPQEYPALSCRIVDVALPEPGSPREAALVDHLVGELLSGDSDPVVAYRGSHRWVQDFEPLAKPVARTILRASGTYLLTGGFGRVGALLAEHLARTVRARLILVGRLSLPGRAAWPAWLDSHSDTDPVSRRIRQVERLEALGAEVEVASVDVADAAGLADAVRKAEARFGRIDGLIHAAGLVEESAFLAIDDMDPSAGEAHFRAKVEGVLALDQVLGERPLDFWLLASSLATVVGGAGFAAYAAANAFMDTFAYARRRRSPVPCIAVNWDSWQVGDWSGHASLAPLALTPDEGLATFELALSSPDVTQVVVSTAALADRLERALPSRPHRPPVVPTEPIPSAEPILPERNRRPDSPERAREPQTEMERMIASVWQELLGVPQVVVRDNFFDLGGPSLLAIKLIHRLEKATGVRVDPAELMFHTLGQLAAAVEVRMPSRSSGRTRGTSRLLSTVRSLVQGFAPRGGTPQ